MELFVPSALQIDCLAEMKEKLHLGSYVLCHSPKECDLYDPKFKGLVFMDLDDTLACSEVVEDGREYDSTIEYKSSQYGVKIRPWSVEFLNFLRHEMNFKVVLFTVGLREYSDQILKLISFNFDICLYRESCTTYTNKENGKLVYSKDLKLFSSNPSRTVLIDNSYINSLLCTYNVFVVKECTIPSLMRGNDNFLKILRSALERLMKESDDWRDIVRRGYNEVMAKVEDYEKEVYDMERIRKYCL